MTGWIFAALSVLVLVAGAAARRRILRRTRPVADGLSDDDVRQIEEGGLLFREDDEPLDMDEIRAEEDRFWASESWDRAEER